MPRRALCGSRCVGSRDFVEKVKSDPGIKALHRELEQVDGRTRCENLVKLTGFNSTEKMSL
jgi:hypothetical protein